MAPLPPRSFYVSPSGNNSNDGTTTSTPLLTLALALCENKVLD